MSECKLKLVSLKWSRSCKIRALLFSGKGRNGKAQCRFTDREFCCGVKMSLPCFQANQVTNHKLEVALGELQEMKAAMETLRLQVSGMKALKLI